MISKRSIERGDAMQVVRMAKARNGKEWSRSYVTKCIHGERHNASILALHDELVALRTPKNKAKR